MGTGMWRGHFCPRNLSRKGNEVGCNPFVKQNESKLAFGHRFHHEFEGSFAGDVQIESVHEMQDLRDPAKLDPSVLKIVKRTH